MIEIREDGRCMCDHQARSLYKSPIFTGNSRHDTDGSAIRTTGNKVSTALLTIRTSCCLFYIDLPEIEQKKRASRVRSLLKPPIRETADPFNSLDFQLLLWVIFLVLWTNDPKNLNRLRDESTQGNVEWNKNCHLPLQFWSRELKVSPILRSHSMPDDIISLRKHMGTTIDRRRRIPWRNRLFHG